MIEEKESTRHRIIQEIVEERYIQDKKWGEQDHHPLFWLTILMEEVGEASRAVLDLKLLEYREEMVQVAAVALSMLETFDRQAWGTPEELVFAVMPGKHFKKLR